MNIKVGSKHISMNDALEYYYDRDLCKNKFGLNDREYDKLVSKMLKKIKKQKQPVSPTPTFQKPLPRSQPQTTFQPRTTFQQPQPQPTFQQPQPQPTFQHPQPQTTFQQSQPQVQETPKNELNSQSLLDRRFFQGFHTPVAPPNPLRFAETNTSTTVNTNKIFSRMFDIPNQQLPDITSDRQQICSRRW